MTQTALLVTVAVAATGLVLIGLIPIPRRKEFRMLTLSRKIGEQIVVGDDIRITVVDIGRGKVRLGIEAPRDVMISRLELLPQQTPAQSEDQR